VLYLRDQALFWRSLEERFFFVHGRTMSDGDRNHNLYRALYQQDRFGSMTSLLAGITAGPPDPSPPFPIVRRAGTVRTNGRAFKDNDGEWAPIGATLFLAGWSYHANRARLDRQIRWILGAGGSYARILASQDWQAPHNAPVHLGEWETTLEAIDYMWSKGLRTALTLFSRRSLVAHPIHWVTDMAESLETRRDRIMWVEIANESSHPGNGWTDDEVKRLCDQFAAASPILTCSSAPHGEQSHTRLHTLYEGTNADIATIHYPRKHDTAEGWWRPVRQPWHTRFGSSDWPTPIVDNEHFNYMSVTGADRVAVSAAAIANAFIAGCGASCHHDRPGVWPDTEYAIQHEADRLQQTIRAVAHALPGDIANWSRFRPGESHYPFPSLTNQHWSFGADIGVSRAYAAVKGDQIVMALNGVRDKVTIHEQTTWPYRVLSLRDGGPVYEGLGPVTLKESTAEAFLLVPA